MSTTPQPASIAEAAEDRQPCFLCALDGSRCQIPMLEGTLIGARVERREPKQIPVVGLVMADGSRVRLNLGPGAIALVERLAVLPANVLQQLHLRALHLVHGKANAPAPGQPPFRVALALPASLAIIEPDLLLNITDLSHGTYCVRQEVLRDLFPSPPSAAGLCGTLIHNIFKEMLKDPDATPEDVLEDGLRGAVVALAEAGVTEAEVRGDVAAHLENLAQWRTRQAEKLNHARVRAETFLLAPEIGLKGRLDILLDGGQRRDLLELKTGRASGDLPKQDHRWQVYGYHALLAARMADRTQAKPMATLLYSGTPGGAAGYGIPVALREMQRVISIRNDLALVRLTNTVPPPPGGNKCARCAMHASCAETSALIGWQPPPGDPPLPTAERDGAWFRHWWTLQRLEGRIAEQQTYALWRQSAAERIRDGVAIGPLELLAPPEATDRHEWIYSFGCDNTSELREGDEVLLSDGDPVRGEVVSGAILAIGADCVTLWAREQINRPALIDRYSADVVNRRMQHNLTRWLHVDDHRRALVRGDLRPRFDRDPPPLNPATMAGLNGEQADAVVRALTMRDYLLIQGPPGTGKTKVIAAIAAALAGRGFRVALAAATNQATDTLLARLVEQGARNVIRLGHELATAPEMRPYRLLAQARARTGEAAPSAEAVRAILRAAPVVAATVATWSAEAHDVDGTMPLFDVVIVDEATQLTLPAALGALRWGRRFILVGDQHQLPPVVQSPAALASGLGISLFETLLAKAPEEARVALRRQYRMHAAICAFPSQQFYHGRLVADDAVARATLAITPARHAAILDPARPVVWVEVGPTPRPPPHCDGEGETGLPSDRQDLRDQPRLSVLPSPSADGEGPGVGPTRAKVNEAEAHAAADLAVAMVESGLAPEAIGIIAPFRAQVARIRQVAGDFVARGLTIDTVDRFQGGERAAIILSLTAAAPLAADSPLAPFLSDPRRLNVALSRARHKLIILGHRAAFAEQPLLRALAEACGDAMQM